MCRPGCRTGCAAMRAPRSSQHRPRAQAAARGGWFGPRSSASARRTYTRARGGRPPCETGNDEAVCPCSGAGSGSPPPSRIPVGRIAIQRGGNTAAMEIAFGAVAALGLLAALVYVALLLWGAVEDGRDQRRRDRQLPR